jgi:hypothetical protein
LIDNQKIKRVENKLQLLIRKRIPPFGDILLVNPGDIPESASVLDDKRRV